MRRILIVLAERTGLAFRPLASDLVFVRVDDRISLVALAGFGSVDSELTEELSRLVTDRM